MCAKGATWTAGIRPPLPVVLVVRGAHAVAPRRRCSITTVSPLRPWPAASRSAPVSHAVPPWNTSVRETARLRLVAAGGAGVAGGEASESGPGPSALVAVTVTVYGV